MRYTVLVWKTNSLFPTEQIPYGDFDVALKNAKRLAQTMQLKKIRHRYQWYHPIDPTLGIGIKQEQ